MALSVRYCAFTRLTALEDIEASSYSNGSYTGYTNDCCAVHTLCDLPYTLHLLLRCPAACAHIQYTHSKVGDVAIVTSVTAHSSVALKQLKSVMPQL
jgi:hypothetical protein